jgi:hypothetical protein
LKTGVYRGSENFRGLYADRWTLPELDIDYIARSDSIHTPRTSTELSLSLALFISHLLTRACAYLAAVRSTNQAEDPGATDYLDVVLGPQDPALFKLPTYCKKIINKGCPPDSP